MLFCSHVRQGVGPVDDRLLPGLGRVTVPGLLGQPPLVSALPARLPDLCLPVLPQVVPALPAPLPGLGLPRSSPLSLSVLAASSAPLPP